MKLRIHQLLLENQKMLKRLSHFWRGLTVLQNVILYTEQNLYQNNTIRNSPA